LKGYTKISKKGQKYIAIYFDKDKCKYQGFSGFLVGNKNRNNSNTANSYGRLKALNQEFFLIGFNRKTDEEIFVELVVNENKIKNKEKIK
jgi:hypothetical protein